MASSSQRVVGAIIATAVSLGGLWAVYPTPPVATTSPPAAPSSPAAPEPLPVVPHVQVTPQAGRLSDFALSLPTRSVRSPVAVAPTDDVIATRDFLRSVVREHGRDPNNPWAIGHSMLALGADLELSNGVAAVDHLFSEYAEVVTIGGVDVLRFPRKRGDIRIEPHTDLLLKAMTESGVSPDRKVMVGGRAFTVADLYRHSVYRAWSTPSAVSFDDFNDAPWALQGIAAWAPSDAAWTAQGGREMTLSGLRENVAAHSYAQSAFLREAAIAGKPVVKRGQHIFGYTCGGAHLFQGVAYAVARHGAEGVDAQRMQHEVAVLFFRLRQELNQVDAALQQAPEYGPILLVQRLKFLGHFLESVHKAAAMSLFAPNQAQKDELAYALDQLVGTVDVLQKIGVFKKLPELKKTQEQMYLDVIGDSAHAIRGLELAIGEGEVRY